MLKRLRLALLISVLCLCILGCAAPTKMEYLAEDEVERLNALPRTLQTETPFLLIGADETERNFSCRLLEGGQADLLLFTPDGARRIPTTAMEDGEGAVYLNARFDGLVPGSDYRYYLFNGTARTDAAAFSAIDAESDLSFLFAADPQLPITSKEVLPAAWRRSVELGLLEAPGAAFLLSGGDQVDDPNIMDEYRRFDFDNLFASLALAPCRGNHDADCSLYDRFFPTPNTEEETGYYFSYGHALFVVLNSNDNDFNTYQALIQKAKKAYKKEKRNEPDFLIVTQHHPMFSNGDYSLHRDTIQRQEALAPIFSEENVDLVLMGHEHQYSRSLLMHGTEVSPFSEAIERKLYPGAGDTLYITASTASGVKYYEPDNDDFHKYTAVTLQMNEPEISVVTIRGRTLTVETFTTGEAFYPIDTVTLIKSDKEQ